MGTEYTIACRTCKVGRDLDKFYTASIYPVTNRKEALDFKKHIKADSFRAGLMVSFLGAHMGHDVVFFDEHQESIADECDPMWGDENGYKYDGEFWTPSRPVTIE